MFSAENIQDVFGLSGNKAMAQLGIWHQVPCLAIREGEALLNVIWHKGQSLDDPHKEVILSYSVGKEDLPSRDRHRLSPGYSLIIKGVQESDSGSYLCQVVPWHTVDRVGRIDLQVIGETW